MRAFLRFILLAPIAVAAILFSLANRAPVTVSFDPFNPAAPAYALSPPLYLVVLIAIGVGLIFGGAAAWLGQGRHRRNARALRREAQALRAETERLRADRAAAPALAEPR